MNFWGGLGQVVIQTIPTMVPPTAENGDKITVQLAKIITIPAHQLAQCQLQTSTSTNKPGVGASPAGISLLGSPLTVRAVAPVNVTPGAHVIRLTVPTQTQQQTLVVSQAGSGAGVATVSTANQPVTNSWSAQHKVSPMCVSVCMCVGESEMKQLS